MCVSVQYVLCVHRSPGNQLVIPYAGVIADTQCVKSQYWQSVLHSPVFVCMCVCVCVCVCLSSPSAAPTLRLHNTSALPLTLAPHGLMSPFKVQMSHIHMSVCSSSDPKQSSSRQHHTCSVKVMCPDLNVYFKHRNTWKTWKRNLSKASISSEL